jgi:hypothetical protein
VLTTANAAGTNSLTCLPKHGRARVKIFLVTHPMTDQRCLTSEVARRSVLTTEPSSSLSTYCLTPKGVMVVKGLMRCVLYSDIVKKKRDEHLKMVWRVSPSHKRLQARMEHMRRFRRHHEQLRTVMLRVSNNISFRISSSSANECPHSWVTGPFLWIAH